MSSEADTTSAVSTPVTPTKQASAPGSAQSTPSKESDEAMNQLVQGKRHLLVRDYSSAVVCLGKACELLAQRFGDTAPECGDAYLSYGKALLELARTESGVVELNESDKGDSDQEEEEGEGEEEEGEDGAEEQAESESKETEGKEQKNGDVKDAKGEPSTETTNGDSHDVKEAKKNGVEEAKENDAEEAKENDAEEAKENDAEEAKENGAKGDEDCDKPEDEEDVNNLQLAWEMLELAKLVFQKQLDTADDKHTALKLTEVYLKLGEVGVESENFLTAIEDMKFCLDLQRKCLDEDDRRIAETLYNMGTAYHLSNDFDAAIEHFKEAGLQIEKRIATLEKRKAGAEPAEKESSEDAFYTVQGEIDELKALLPEMKEKINDMKDFKQETLRRLIEKVAEESAKKSSTADGAGPSSAKDKPVSSVAHLVKRKPKEEAEAKVDGSKAITEATDSSEKVKEPSIESKDPASEDAPSESMDVEKADTPKEDKAEADKKRKPEESEELSESQKKLKVDDSKESTPVE